MKVYKLNKDANDISADDLLRAERYEKIKEAKFAEWMGLELIASDFVSAHYLHGQALKTSRLVYLHELMDAIATSNGGTVREIVTELLDMVPDITEEEAFALARVKYHELNLDTKVA